LFFGVLVGTAIALANHLKVNVAQWRLLMPKMNFETLLDKHLKNAASLNVSTPVIAVLNPQSSHACAVHADHYGRRLRCCRHDYLDGEGLMVTWTVPEAINLLRRHCGLGGSAVANRLQIQNIKSGHWLVVFGEDKLTAIAFPRDAEPLAANVLYDRLPFELYNWQALLPEPPIVLARLTSGKQVEPERWTECMPDRLGYLLLIVNSGCLTEPPPTSRDNDMGYLMLPLHYADLAGILRDHYMGAPELVAETILRIRDAGMRSHLWLLKVLHGCPILQPLAERVQMELAKAKKHAATGRSQRQKNGRLILIPEIMPATNSVLLSGV
jgi:hypothetical protein